MKRKYNVAVASTGYVGLSIATLLAQHNHVTAVAAKVFRWREDADFELDNNFAEQSANNRSKI